jgi:hypothetical protein
VGVRMQAHAEGQSAHLQKDRHAHAIQEVNGQEVREGES